MFRTKTSVHPAPEGNELDLRRARKTGIGDKQVGLRFATAVSTLLLILTTLMFLPVVAATAQSRVVVSQGDRVLLLYEGPIHDRILDVNGVEVDRILDLSFTLIGQAEQIQIDSGLTTPVLSVTNAKIVDSKLSSWEVQPSTAGISILRLVGIPSNDAQTLLRVSSNSEILMTVFRGSPGSPAPELPVALTLTPQVFTMLLAGLGISGIALFTLFAALRMRPRSHKPITEPRKDEASPEPY